MRRSTLLLALLALPPAVQAQGRFPLTIGTRDSIHSAILKEKRTFLVYTPPSYRDTTWTPQRYPVLYLLDGDAHFHSVSGLVQILGTGINGTYAIPEMIVVAIANTDRTRDMTPTRVEKGFDGWPAPRLKTSGGMANFLSFIRSELIPRIDSTYRTSPYRIFVGHSLGGITVINALYTIPETFNAYVAIDPSLWWDDRVLLKQAKDYLAKGNYQQRVLFLGQANTLNPDDTTSNPHFNAMLQFNSVVETYNTSGLRYGYRYYANDDHGSVPLISEYDALRFIFEGYRVPLLRVLEQPKVLTEHFRAVSEQLGAPFQPSEGMVMQLAGLALGRDTAKAIALYEVGTELYPKSHRSFDRLGALWAAKGDKPKAIAYYQRSLALNPGNGFSAQKLKELQR
jgi:hypothetical protein